MKVSLEWLREYLPGPLDSQRAVEALTNGGLPVESDEPFGPDDRVIDVEVTSNRSDCLSHVGVARELSALLNREFRNVTPRAAESVTQASSATSVAIEAPDLCPHYTARIIRNVKVRPSPPWLARRLEAVGLRPINNVADVTNYVLFEMGQPLHAFDFDRLEGRRIVVRRARKGEKLVSIDGRERELTPDMLAIADAARPVAIAGVMGGRDTEVSERTVNVLLESARFDPLSVRRTSRALTLKSDSSYRFERGIDPTLPERASLRAAQLILETGGGELLAGLVSAGQSGYRPKALSLRLAKLKQVLGVELPTQDVIGAFTRLGLSPVLKGDRIDVTVPSHRLDLNIEVDLVEEAIRVLGYDRVPVRDEISIRLAPRQPERVALGMINSTLVGAGYFEAITFTISGGELFKPFLPPESEADRSRQVKVSAGTKWSELRPSLIPTLLSARQTNEAVGTPNVKLYEMGSAFWYSPTGQTIERRRLGLVGSDDVREVRGEVEKVLRRLDADRQVRVVPDARPGFAAGACGRIEWGGQAVGYLGKIDRNLAAGFGLREPPAAAELELPPLLAGAQLVPQLHPLPEFPAAERDLNFILPESTRYEALESTVREAKPEHLEDLRYVTTYRGKQIDKGHKSITITLVFRSPTGTLTGEQVEASVNRVVDAARQKLGATLRT